MSRAARRGWRYRVNVAARSLVAIVGGYAIAALFTMAAARWLPMAKIDAVLVATMLAFALIPGVAVWAFLTRTPFRAVTGAVLVAGLLALACWAVGPP